MQFPGTSSYPLPRVMKLSEQFQKCSLLSDQMGDAVHKAYSTLCVYVKSPCFYTYFSSPVAPSGTFENPVGFSSVSCLCLGWYNKYSTIKRCPKHNRNIFLTVSEAEKSRTQALMSSGSGSLCEFSFIKTAHLFMRVHSLELIIPQRFLLLIPPSW